LGGCDDAYQAVLAELGNDEVRLRNVANKNKTRSLIKNGQSKIKQKAIDTAVLLSATNTFLAQCLLTACDADCTALFAAVLTAAELKTALTATNADFEGKCLPPTTGGGGGADGGDGGDDDGDNDGDAGFLRVESNKLLLLISLTIGYLIF
jgi:hypothetical protein